MFLVLSSRFFCIFSWWVICPFKTLNHSVHTQLLLANLDQPSPNVTHLLLRFDIDQPVERTVLQPKRHFSCLRVILDQLDTLTRPEVNASLHELGFQVWKLLWVSLALLEFVSF
jgi:hypothetical protein